MAARAAIAIERHQQAILNQRCTVFVSVQPFNDLFELTHCSDSFMHPHTLRKNSPWNPFEATPRFGINAGGDTAINPLTLFCSIFRSSRGAANRLCTLRDCCHVTTPGRCDLTLQAPKRP
jgi:hypothetical protein